MVDYKTMYYTLLNAVRTAEDVLSKALEDCDESFRAFSELSERLGITEDDGEI